MGMWFRGVLPIALSVLLWACEGSARPADAATVPDAGTADAIASPDGQVTSDAGTVYQRPVFDPGPPTPYPVPSAWGPNRGPGGPTRTFETDALFAHCAYLDGGEEDGADHHNLVTMYDGYLLMPWAPEWGGGGLTFFDYSDPCNPVTVGTGYSEHMRETHSIGFSSHGGRWAVVNHVRQLLEIGAGGVEFWDVSDVTAPVQVSALELPGFLYPDAYAWVTLSVFWQAPYVYVAGADNGIYIVDATDPTAPLFVDQYTFDPVLRAGQIQAVGNLLIVTSAEGPRTVLLDISDPIAPMPIPGGDFLQVDGTGEPADAYFSNFVAGHVIYARKDGGAGIMLYDVRDPTSPNLAGELLSNGNGGYVFTQGHFAFVGESRFAAIYDFSDMGNITEVTRLELVGDLDTATPIGNTVVLSVDADAEDDRGSAAVPWREEPDSEAPRVTWSWPADGAEGVARTSRVGLTMSEHVDIKSAFDGSVRLYATDKGPTAEGRVPGIVSVQELIVSFFPMTPLEPGTSYTLEVPAGGIVDFNGNAVDEPFTMTFTTAGE